MGHFTTVVEIPYRFCERNAGESKLDSKVTMQYIKQLFGLIRRQTKKKIVVTKLSDQQTREYVSKIDEG